MKHNKSVVNQTMHLYKQYISNLHDYTAHLKETLCKLPLSIKVSYVHIDAHDVVKVHDATFLH